MTDLNITETSMYSLYTKFGYIIYDKKERVFHLHRKIKPLCVIPEHPHYITLSACRMTLLLQSLRCAFIIQGPSKKELMYGFKSTHNFATPTSKNCMYAQDIQLKRWFDGFPEMIVLTVHADCQEDSINYPVALRQFVFYRRGKNAKPLYDCTYEFPSTDLTQWTEIDTSILWEAEDVPLLRDFLLQCNMLLPPPC